MSNIEEGSPLIAEVKAEVATTNRRPLIVAAALATLATTACIGYATSFSKPSAGFVGDFKPAMNLAVDAKTANNAAKAAVVVMDSKPFAHLEGKTVSSTVQELDSQEGSWMQDPNSKYSYVVDLFKNVAKVSYNKDGSVKEKYNLGSFYGLDGQANAMFTDGEYCSPEKGPYFTRVSFVCGPTLRISTVHMRDECQYNIAIKTPEQCAPNTVKFAGTPKERKEAKERVWDLYGEGVEN